MPLEVLLVEDSPGDVRLTQEAFREVDSLIRLHVVNDGVEAIAFLNRTGSHAQAPRPDIILLDLNLPKMNGHQVLAQVKANPSLRTIPMVILTTSEELVDITKSYQLQANCYLNKPVQLEAFELLVRSIIDFWLTKVKLPRQLERAHRAKSIRKVLLVEDNPGDARLVREMLNEDGSYTTDITHVETIGDAKKLFPDRAFDLILLDLGLPDAQGIGAVQQVRSAAPHSPLVVMTSLDDDLVAGQALKEGSQDYLVKGHTDTRSLLRCLRHATQRKAMEEKLSDQKDQVTHSAQHDFLTGLPNRLLLNDRIAQAITLAPRHKKKVAVLFLDLNGFKQINDSLGHLTSDKLFRSVANRLVECVRGSDTVSRHGGDEFVVLLSEVTQSGDAAIMVKRMLQAVSEVHLIEDQSVHVTSSIGVSIYPDDGGDAESLIQSADVAMYRAKGDKSSPRTGPSGHRNRRQVVSRVDSSRSSKRIPPARFQ
jgi:diguanylate cyclase (GGDEF)-like protein